MGAAFQISVVCHESTIGGITAIIFHKDKPPSAKFDPYGYPEKPV
jgi:hypothetical protein